MWPQAAGEAEKSGYKLSSLAENKHDLLPEAGYNVVLHTIKVLLATTTTKREWALGKKISVGNTSFHNIYPLSEIN